MTPWETKGSAGSFRLLLTRYEAIRFRLKKPDSGHAWKPISIHDIPIWPVVYRIQKLLKICGAGLCQITVPRRRRVNIPLADRKTSLTRLTRSQAPN